MPVVDDVTVVYPGDDGKTAVVLEGFGTTILVVDGSGFESIEDMSRPAAGLAIVRNEGDVAVFFDGDRQLAQVGPLEASAFGERLKSGYLLVDVDDSSFSHEWVESNVHPFVVHEVVLEGLGSSRELVTTVGEAVKDIDRASCLRVELRGRIPLGVYINTEDLAAQLERYFFYVEVIDECDLDIDVADLETDVSLLAEFVRQVTGDDSLSETEKTRILRCGWNALNGKELVE